jgi:hypothetical protein
LPPPGSERFACRKCYNLSYATRSYDRIDRSNSRAQTIRLKLGGTASLLDGFPSKPKGMWWTTYLRLGGQYRKHSTTALNLFLERMKIPPLFPE